MLMCSGDKSEVIRVCFVAPKAYPLFNPDVKKVFGGAEVDLYFLATELAKDENFAVSFITADYGQEDFETIEDVRVIKSVDFNKNSLVGATRVWQAMHAADSQIYFQETACWGTFLAAMFCRLRNKMFVYRTAHLIDCDGTYCKQHFLAGKAFRWSLRNATQVVVQNKTDEMKIKQTIGVFSKVIPNAHHLPAVPQAKRDIILWVGRSVRFKRPKLFVDLAEKMPREQFVMICQCATGDQNYEALLAEAKKVDNLQFIERVPFSEIDSYFQRAKVFVNTSDSEGFPNTFIQACNSAAPILSLKVNPDDFINRYNCGISCNGDWQRMLDSLKVMLEDERYMEMGENGKKYVEERHDVGKIIKQYKELFKELVKHKDAIPHD